ncbi:uncharacterized protein PAC_14746 [Phialocephala subalpina]|uniref:Uncharacterized protein n=1 Tax=Phialocephala subalpina TaxID=576137 RepID=A0A1L7XIR4_9HELO|nr:uncharacterized protein PAC_14746 [Phialocephala subalpina]
MRSWPVFTIYTQSWVNYLKDYKNGKAKDRDQKARFRFPENFQENTVCEHQPIQVEFMEKIQQSSYWTSQAMKFPMQALKPKRIFGHYHVQATGKKVATLYRPDYPSIHDNKYGKLIARTRDDLEQQRQASKSKKRRSSNAQGRPAAKRLNTDRIQHWTRNVYAIDGQTWIFQNGVLRPLAHLPDVEVGIAEQRRRKVYMVFGRMKTTQNEIQVTSLCMISCTNHQTAFEFPSPCIREFGFTSDERYPRHSSRACDTYQYPRFTGAPKPNLERPCPSRVFRTFTYS